jgi:glucose-6-phosphate-specific signal transduction histidine kinase
MFVSPVPRIGDVVVGRDAVGRVLRISAHPSSDRLVLSIWQDGTCLGTVRLAGDDLPELIETLTALGAALQIPRAG